MEKKNSTAYYEIGGYPDCLDDYKVIRFSTMDPQYNILGISVGDDLKKAIQILDERSYKKSEESPSAINRLVFEKAKVNISLTTESSRVTEIAIWLYVTNVENVQF